MDQKEFYIKLTRYTHPSDLKVAVCSFDQKTGTYHPGKRYNADKFAIYDERNVAVNEIIWDLDWSSWKANYQKAKLLIEALDNRKIPYYICATGGKGIHIHTFFNRLNFNTESGKKMFKEALSYGFTYKHLRLWIWETIIREAGIDEHFIGKGNKIDSAPLIFNYYAGTTHLIRALGGRKFSKNAEGDWIPRYKTYIPKEDFSHRKPMITEYANVKYPPFIPTFDIDENELLSYLDSFIKTHEKTNIERLSNESLPDKYINIDGVLKIREGLGEGVRSAGASIIAIAARIDNIPKKEAYELIEDYVKNCSQVGTPFTVAEAKQWVDWIYNHEKPFWNCQLLKDINVHESSTCQFCMAKNKEALKFLTQTTMLDQIKDVLDEFIVGEDDTKMLVFLLMLSKDFPSRSGKANWCIANDPSSQNIIMSSDSASGKSWIIKNILTLFGEEEIDYYIISRLTKNAINYFTDINMDGKIIFIEEMQGLDEHTSQLRLWMSEGKLSLRTVEKILNEEGVEVNTLVTKTTIGQPVFVTNQAEGVIEDQLNNRSWILSMDVSEFQTAKILKYQDRLAKGVKPIDPSKIRVIRESLKQLKPYHFIIPFADHQLMGIPLHDVRSRRDYHKFLTLIQCSAYLHQKQRKIVKDDDQREYIICDIQDYNISKQYAQNVLGATFSGLTLAQIELLTNIKNSSWREEFCIKDLMRSFGKSQPHWYGMLKQLIDLGFIAADKELGRSTVYHIVMEKAVNVINLPSGEELLSRLGDKPAISAISEKNEIEEKNGKEDSKKISDPKNGFIALIADQNQKSAEIDKYNENNQLTEKTHDLLIKLPFTQEKRSSSINDEHFINRKGAEIIGDVTRISIMEFMGKSNKHMFDYEDLLERFKDDQKLKKVLDTMITEGSIYEPKPGRYMIL